MTVAGRLAPPNKGIVPPAALRRKPGFVLEAKIALPGPSSVTNSLTAKLRRRERLFAKESEERRDNCALCYE